MAIEIQKHTSNTPAQRKAHNSGVRTRVLRFPVERTRQAPTSVLEQNVTQQIEPRSHDGVEIHTPTILGALLGEMHQDVVNQALMQAQRNARHLSDGNIPEIVVTAADLKVTLSKVQVLDRMATKIQAGLVTLGIELDPPSSNKTPNEPSFTSNKTDGLLMPRSSNDDQLTQEEIDSLVVDNMRLAKHYIREVALVPVFIDYDDMHSAALEGLLNAARRFKPTRGIRFSSFAIHRIRGALKDEMRKITGRRGKKLEPTAISLDSALYEDDEGNSNMDSVLYRTGNFDEIPANAAELGYSTSDVNRTEILKTLGEVLDSREYVIVRDHLGFAEDQTQTMAVLAESLGISESRVSQIFSRAITKIRQQPTITEKVLALL